MEWRMVVRDRSIAALTLVALLACAFAAFEGIQCALAAKRSIDGVQAAERAHIESARAVAHQADCGEVRPVWYRDPRNPGVFANAMAAAVTRPLTPSAALAVGEGALFPRYYSVHIGSRTKLFTAFEYDNPHLLQSGHFDFVFVIVFLYPLLIAGACHGVRTADVERGLDPMLRIACGSSRPLYWRRALLRTAPITLVMVATTLAVCLWTGLRILGWPLGRSLADAAGPLLIAGTYTLGWLLLTALCARASTTPVRALYRLAALWIATLVIVPGLAGIAARALHPVPSRAAYVREQRDTVDQLTRQGKVSNSSAANAVFYAVRLRNEEQIEQTMAALDQRYQFARHGQDRVAAWFRVLSPALAARWALDRWTANDSTTHWDFVRQATTYQQRLREYFRPMLTDSITLNSAQFERNARYPRFVFTPVRNGL
jgi:ABC-2 type transport system permease protein